MFLMKLTQDEIFELQVLGFNPLNQVYVFNAGVSMASTDFTEF